MMNYKLEIIKSEKINEPFLSIKFDDKEKELLSFYLMSSNVSYKDKDEYLSTVDNVVNGNIGTDNLHNEAFWVDITIEKTILELDYDITGQNGKLELATKEFREILEVWFNKLEQFKLTGKID